MAVNLECKEKARCSIFKGEDDREPSYLKERSPDMKVVRTTIKYTIATEGLDQNDEEGPSQPQ